MTSAGGVYFAGGIMPDLQRRNPARRNVEPGHPHAARTQPFGQSDGDRQADIAKPHDCDICIYARGLA